MGVRPFAKIVEFNEVRQTITLPAAGRNAALTSFEYGIQVTDFQDGLLRLARNPLSQDRLDAHRGQVHESIQETDPVLDHASRRHMTIQQYQVPAGVLFCISPHFCQKLRIDLQILVFRANESDLAQVQGFTSDIDVGGSEIIEPKPGFKIVDNRYPAAASPFACPFDDLGAGKGPVLDGLAKVREAEARNLPVY